MADTVSTNGVATTAPGVGGHGGHRKAQVVVVGAGVAGLTAAAKLVSNGVKDVVVLEAQDYVGGRVKAEIRGDTRYDLGAMFIHGEEGNPIYEIVQKLGALNDSRGGWPPYFYTSNNTKVPLGQIEDLFDYIEECMEDDEHDPQIGQNRLEFFTRDFDQFLTDNKITTNHAKKDLYDAAFRWFCFFDEINEGVDSLSDVSQWVLGQHYVTLEGEQETLIKGGYSTVIRALEAIVPKGVIHTGVPVHNIDWTHPKDGGILVRCANGTVYTADHVIVTISMGCLKAVHTSLFTPSLPSPLVKTMDRVRMGTIGKIFLRWDKPFWTKDNTHFDFLWLNSNPATLKSDKSKRKTRLGKLWWQYLSGLQTVSEQDNLLVVWLSEHQLDAIRDIEDQEIGAILYELMQVFVHDVNVTMPNEIYRTRWKENPYTRGTYTYPLPSFDATDVENITTPTYPSQKNPRLLFAGEAYTVQYMTNVHGAYITGERQAETVLAAYGINNTRRVVEAVTKNA